jgi:hypothetical protein
MSRSSQHVPQDVAGKSAIRINLDRAPRFRNSGIENAREHIGAGQHCPRFRIRFVQCDCAPRCFEHMPLKFIAIGAREKAMFLDESIGQSSMRSAIGGIGFDSAVKHLSRLLVGLFTSFID